VPKAKVAYIPVPCMHCDSPTCIPACPVKDAIYKRPDGLVLIDPKKCTGCKLCIDACAYGAIFFNSSLNIAQKCTGCAHLIDRGWPIKQPRCADACLQDAIHFGEESELGSWISKREVYHPEYNLKPRVSYVGLPKRFIAGTLYDPDKDEVVIGGKCTLTGAASLDTTTDGFGDFWFEGLPVGDFSLKFEAAGKTKTMEAINTAKDVNLGDVALAGGSTANPVRTYPPKVAEITVTTIEVAKTVKADANWQILNDVLDVTTHITYCRGNIKNISTATHSAKITVDFLDFSAKPLYTKIANVADVPAGETKPWEVSISVSSGTGVANYSINGETV